MPTSPEKRKSYSSHSIRYSLRLFEERHGMTSEAFYDAYRRDDPSLRSVPGVDQRVWESLYVELEDVGETPSLPSDSGLLIRA